MDVLWGIRGTRCSITKMAKAERDREHQPICKIMDLLEEIQSRLKIGIERMDYDNNTSVRYFLNDS